MITSSLWASPIERGAEPRFIYLSQPLPAGGSREVGIQVALPPESYWKRLNEGDVEGSGRHHGDDNEDEGGGKDEPL
jgi:hypothetical protein